MCVCESPEREREGEKEGQAGAGRWGREERRCLGKTQFLLQQFLILPSLDHTLNFLLWVSFSCGAWPHTPNSPFFCNSQLSPQTLRTTPLKALTCNAMSQALLSPDRWNERWFLSLLKWDKKSQVRRVFPGLISFFFPSSRKDGLEDREATGTFTLGPKTVNSQSSVALGWPCVDFFFF